MKHNVSRPSLRSPLALVLISFAIAATLLAFAVAASKKANSGTGVSPMNHAQDARATKPLTRIANRKTLTPVAPFFAATITATLADDITLANKKNPGDTITYTAVITNTAGVGNDASNVIYTDVLDNNTTLVGGSVKSTPIAFDDAYSVIGNVRIQPNAAAGLLVNDIDPDTGTNVGLTATAQTISSGQCAACNNVTINGDGSFSYNPPGGFQGSDTFTYTVNDPTGKTGTGTVTLTVSGMIWFINNNAAGCTTLTLASGCGRLTNPFSTLAAFQGFNDNGAGHPKNNDNIFIFESASNYIGPVTLLSGQRLFGQDSTASLQTLTGLTPQAYSDPFPTMNTGGNATTLISAGVTVTLNGAGTSNNLNGFTVGTSTTTGISGTSFGTLNVGSVILNTGSGQALVLSTGTVSTPANYPGFTSTTSTGGTNNVSLTTIAGTVNLGSGALSGAGGNGFNMNGGAAAINFSGTISNSTARQVSIINKTGGTVALSGAVSGTGTGIFLNSNTGATINFTGGVVLSTGASDAFTATGGGTVNATQNNTSIINTLTTTTGTALNVANTTIGASGLTFRSITSSGASSGIVLNNTGASGSLTVTGNGGTCTTSGDCTGGAIQNSTSTSGGVLLTSTQSPSFTRLNVTDSAGTTDEGILMTNVTGTVTIDTCSIINIPKNGFHLNNFNTNLTGFNFTNSTISCASGQPCQPSGSLGNDGLLVEIRGTSVLPSGLISGSTFSGMRALGVQVQANDTGRIGVNSGSPSVLALNGTNSFVVQNNTFTGNGQGIDIDSSQVSNVTFEVLSNNVVAQVPGAAGNAVNGSATAINTFTAAGADTGPATHSFIGKIDSNIIGTQGTKDSGSGFGNGIRAVVQGQTTQGNITINNNTVRECAIATPINIIGQNGAATTGTATAHFKITNNTLPLPSGTNVDVCGTNTPCIDADIFVLADEGTPVCNVITGNNLFDATAMNGGADIYLAERAGPPAGAQLTVEGTGGSNSAYLIANNTLAGASKFLDEGANTSQVAIGACGTFPSLPQPDDGGNTEETESSKTTVTGGGSSASPSTLAWLKQVLHPVAAFATKLNFLRKSEVPVRPTIISAEKAPATTEVNESKATQKTDDKNVTPQSGETITVNGSGTGFTLPAGKSITITYQATVNTPPLAKSVSTQGSVTFTGGPGGGVLTDDPEPGGATDPTVTNINVTSTWVGGTGTDWNDATNWNPNTYAPGVANAVNDVVIPNVGNQPNIGTTDITIFSLNISNGRTLTIGGARTLTISGNAGGSDLTLDGIISGGALQFAGAGPHSITHTVSIGSISSTNTTTILSPAAVSLNIAAGNDLQMGALVVNSGGSMSLNGHTLSLNAPGTALSVAGTFTPIANGDGASPQAAPPGDGLQSVGGTVVYNGSSAQTGAGIAYFGLTINNSAGVTLTGDATVNGTLTLTSGDLNMGASGQFTLTQPNTTAILPANGAFDVTGGFKRTGAPLPSATAMTFGNANTQITLTGSTLTSLTVQLTKTTPSGTFSGSNIGWPGSIQRYYLITPSAGNFAPATLRLHYNDSELNAGVNPANVEGSLRLYKFVILSPSTGWQQQDPAGGVTTFDSVNNWVQKTGVNGFSPWTLAGASPTAATSTVSGRITDDAGNPVEGAVVRLQGTQDRKTITDAQGNYSFAEVETNGFYTVTPSRVNYDFAPATRGFSALGAHTEASFGAALNGNHQNPLDTTEYFVRQQYVDFLGREPEEQGFNDWTDTINNCAPGDASCDRVHVSEAFFRSEEFQQRGYFIYRFYSTAFGQKPDYAAFVPDLSRVSGFLDATQLEAAKTQFASDFVARAAFVNQYGTLSNAQYVDALAASAGVTLSNRQTLIDSLNAGTMTRGQALRQIAESGEVYAKYYNQAFVVMEYFGYLRRDPDALYLTWISVLDANPADSRRMVEGFVDATEYRNRFAQ